MGIQWRDIVQHIWRGEAHSERKLWIVWRGKAAQAGGTDPNCRSSHAVSIAHIVHPQLPNSRECRFTDRRQSYPKRNNWGTHSLRTGGWRNYGVFPINSENFLQNLSAFFFLITNSLRALSRWCSCLMYFIFPRIACSQCEKCQLFWETWNQVGEWRNYSWGHDQEEGYLLHPDRRPTAQPSFQAQNEEAKVSSPLNLNEALGAEIIGKGTAGLSPEQQGELRQHLRFLPALCIQALVKIKHTLQYPLGLGIHKGIKLVLA